MYLMSNIDNNRLTFEELRKVWTDTTSKLSGNLTSNAHMPADICKRFISNKYFDMKDYESFVVENSMGRRRDVLIYFSISGTHLDLKQLPLLFRKILSLPLPNAFRCPQPLLDPTGEFRGHRT
ncbi:MAG: hypothetical protein FD174_1318 [Geobacteraceae bacterium]|nr:MAG: hypothetical protein FD174_1318 [Geobacteraceae bacterium]